MTRFFEIRERCDGRVPYLLYRPGHTYPCGKTLVANTVKELNTRLTKAGWIVTEEVSLCGDCARHGYTSELKEADEAKG